MRPESLYSIIKKFVARQTTPEEEQSIDRWYDAAEGHELPAMNREELDATHERVWANIQRKTLRGRQRSIRLAVIRWSAAAAVLAVVATTAFFQWQHSQNRPWYANKRDSQKLYEYVNNTKNPVKMALEDGSHIILQPGSSICYPNHFLPKKREVYLEGEAFFEVHRNTARPFYVYYKDVVTHVLGTSFNVNTKAEVVDVAVCTGKVEVYENTASEKPSPNGVIITPNQKATFIKKQARFEVALVEKPVVLPQFRDSLMQKEVNVFDDEPLDTVLAALSKEYGIEILVERDNMNHCRFSGDVSRQDLYEKLSLICAAVNARYEIKGTKILVRGNGCS